MSEFESAAIHRRPLIGLALAVVAGMGSAWLVDEPDDMAWLAVAAVALAAAFLAPRNRAGPVSLHAAVAALAAAYASQSRLLDRNFGFDPVSHRAPISAELVLRIVSDPAAVSERGQDVRVWRFLAVAEQCAVGAGQWRKSGATLEVFAPLREAPEPQYGEVWHALASVRPSRARRVAEIHRILNRDRRFHGSRVVAWCYRQRAAVRRILTRGIEDWPECAAVVCALLLGYRDDMGWELREIFMGTGTAHVFAISGLHVGLFSAVLAGLFRFLGLPQQWRAATLIPFLGLYTLATGASVSAMRAFVMASVYWLAYVVRRRPDAPSALALAALVILLCAPTQIAESGFWYSFLVVGGLLGLAGPAGWEPPLVEETPELPSVGWLATMTHRVRQLATASAVAWIASTPLTIHLGNQVVPGALIGNLIVIPAAFVIVLAGCCSIWLSFWPWMSEAFNHAAAAVAAAVVQIVRWLFHVPGSRFIVAAPSLGWVIAMYLVVAAFRLLQGRPRRVLSASVATVAIAGIWRWATDDRARLVFPPAELSPAILADFPGERGDHLFDPGPAWQGSRLIRWLRSMGVDRLDTIVWTVQDAAHVGATLEVVRRIPTRRIVTAPGAVRSSVVARLTNELAALDIPIEFMVAGERGMWAGGVEYDVWHPPPGRSFTRASDAGMWLRVARGQTAVLFAGPATPRQQECVSALRWDPTATWVVLDRAPNDADRPWLEAVLVSRAIVRTVASYELYVPAAPGSWRVSRRVDEIAIGLNFSPAPARTPQR